VYMADRQHYQWELQSHSS